MKNENGKKNHNGRVRPDCNQNIKKLLLCPQFYCLESKQGLSFQSLLFYNCLKSFQLNSWKCRGRNKLRLNRFSSFSNQHALFLTDKNVKQLFNRLEYSFSSEIKVKNVFMIGKKENTSMREQN